MRKEDEVRGRIEGRRQTYLCPEDAPIPDANIFSTAHFIPTGNTSFRPSLTLRGLNSQSTASRIYLYQIQSRLFPHHLSFTPRSQSTRIHSPNMTTGSAHTLNKTIPTIIINICYPYPQSTYGVLHPLLHAREKMKSQKTRSISQQLRITAL